MDPIYWHPRDYHRVDVEHCVNLVRPNLWVGRRGINGKILLVAGFLKLDRWGCQTCNNRGSQCTYLLTQWQEPQLAHSEDETT
eukprot:8952107-Ditylum_brightwellii.AAC.1